MDWLAQERGQDESVGEVFVACEFEGGLRCRHARLFLFSLKIRNSHACKMWLWYSNTIV